MRIVDFLELQQMHQSQTTYHQAPASAQELKYLLAVYLPTLLELHSPTVVVSLRYARLQEQ